MSQDKGRPLPKFGEWDVNDPASAEGFTVIFNKARNERKLSAGGNGRETSNPQAREMTNASSKHNSKKWLCCIAPAET